MLGEHEHVFYFGHGEVDALVIPRRLFRSRTVLVDEENVRTVGGGIVVAVACWSGRGLARTATSPVAPNRVAGYIGWLDEVSWPAEWSEPIGEAIVEGVSTLLQGGTLGECAAGIRSAFDWAHERYRAEGPNRMSSDRAAFGKMCAAYWKERITIEGDRDVVL